MFKNVPYIKKFDNVGNCINPIKNKYANEYPNRQQRKKQFKAVRFVGNGKNYHLSVGNMAKYHLVQQFIKVENKIRVINHYVS